MYLLAKVRHRFRTQLDWPSTEQSISTLDLQPSTMAHATLVASLPNSSMYRCKPEPLLAWHIARAVLPTSRV